ncbi:MAG: NUDIX hydrolase [Actinomycetes bacterium]
MLGDGNGWVACSQGHRHWGLHGAAGLLLYTVDDAGRVCVLMQHRAEWTHDGGTWGIPGGARDSHEDAPAAALREAREEAGLDTRRVTVVEVQREDHETWSYDTVIAYARRPLPTVPNDESLELRWHPVEQVGALDLHPGFSRSWPLVAATPASLVVDVASITDGTDMLVELVKLRGRVTRTEDDRLIVMRDITTVAEGADAVVEVVRRAEGEVVVVSSDQHLCSRLPRSVSTQPVRWLMVLLSSRDGPR